MSVLCNLMARALINCDKLKKNKQHMFDIH